MKLFNERYQWIFDNCEKLQRAVVALDYSKRNRAWNEDSTYRMALEEVHDLAFSFLMVVMGEHIPTTLWSVDDYSKLYGVITSTDEIIISSDD